MESIFKDSKPPEVHYKACEGLLSLARKTDPVRFEKACRIALDYQKVNYNFIKSLLTGNSILMETEIEIYKPLPETTEKRGKHYYK
jgi:hypothetical protein